MKEFSLPMPPSVLSRVVTAASDSEISKRELAKLINYDPALAADILRAANSAYYGLTTQIASVDRAISMLGIQRVRNLVLCRAVRELVPDKKLDEFPLERFWHNSLRRAASSRALATRVQLDSATVDTCFTVGLCQDLGVLVNVIKKPKLASRYGAAMTLPFSVRLYLEQQVGEVHSEVSASLFETWQIPNELVQPIRYHHWPLGAPEAMQVMTRVVHAAEAVADLFEIDDKGPALSLAHERLANLGLDEGELQEIVTEVNEQVRAAAEMLQLSAPVQPDFEQIAHAASQALATMADSNEETTKQLQDTLVEKLRLVEQLNQLNAQLTLQASTDPLTGLPNRRAFDEALERAVAQAERQGQSLSVLMIDIDFFKKVNDTYGHDVGDVILRQVAATLARTIRKADIAARFGGEEFAVILPFTEAEGAQVVAERIRKLVQTLTIVVEQHSLQVTVSIGGSTLTAPGTDRLGKGTLKLADQALYAAKEGGRDRVEWR